MTRCLRLDRSSFNVSSGQAGARRRWVGPTASRTLWTCIAMHACEPPRLSEYVDVDGILYQDRDRSRPVPGATCTENRRPTITMT